MKNEIEKLKEIIIGYCTNNEYLHYSIKMLLYHEKINKIVLNSPKKDLENFQKYLKSQGFSSKIVKNLISEFGIKYLIGINALTDFYLISLGYKIKMGGISLYNNVLEESAIDWYQKNFHLTNWGKICLNSYFEDSIYGFKKIVTIQAKYVLLNAYLMPMIISQLKDNDNVTLFRKFVLEYIFIVKNCRLIINLPLLINTVGILKNYTFNDFIEDESSYSTMNIYIEDIDFHMENAILAFITQYSKVEYSRHLDNYYELKF